MLSRQSKMFVSLPGQGDDPQSDSERWNWLGPNIHNIDEL